MQKCVFSSVTVKKEFSSELEFIVFEQNEGKKNPNFQKPTKHEPHPWFLQKNKKVGHVIYMSFEDWCARFRLVSSGLVTSVMRIP